MLGCRDIWSGPGWMVLISLCLRPGVAVVMAVEDSMVQVVVRVRPLTPRELESQRRPVVQVVDEQVLVFDPEEPDGGFLGLKWGSTHEGPKKKGKDLTFVFDRVFGEAASQQDVFQHTTHSILDSFLQGYNCSGEYPSSNEEEPWPVTALPPCFLFAVSWVFRQAPTSPSAGHLLRRALALAVSVGPPFILLCVRHSPGPWDLTAGQTDMVPVL